ncbi:DNA polymerase III subunit beta [Succinimonas amylolytica]|uniref:DNA polymerase III subunit beta n=1 Tax=Succinimonas amylolytica TaxID=83769 RepID=UPI00038285EF|nr:DNA polymerase III subunit beta [Succinimonas amylolytica]
MRFKIQREAFIKPLEQISGSVGTNQKEPITQNVLMKIEYNDPTGPIKDTEYKMYLICTDTEIELVSEVGLYGPVEKGAITVEAKKLATIVKSLPEGCFVEVIESTDRKSITLSTDRNTFSLSTLPAEQFPEIEILASSYSMKIKASTLLDMMKTTSFAIPQENYRVALKGMCFTLRQETGSHKDLDIYTSDAHRANIQRAELEEECIFPENYNGRNSFILPKKTVGEVIRLLNEYSKDKSFQDSVIELFVGKNSFRTEINGVTVISCLIDSDYPNILMIVPNNCNRVITLDRESFKNSLERVKILCNSLNNAVELIVVNSSITIKAKNSLHEEAVEHIIAEYEGDDFNLAYKADYLIDICKNMTAKKIKISMTTNSNSAKVEAVAGEGEQISQACYVVSRIVI